MVQKIILIFLGPIVPQCDKHPFCRFNCIAAPDIAPVSNAGLSKAMTMPFVDAKDAAGIYADFQ